MTVDLFVAAGRGPTAAVRRHAEAAAAAGRSRCSFGASDLRPQKLYGPGRHHGQPRITGEQAAGRREQTTHGSAQSAGQLHEAAAGRQQL